MNELKLQLDDNSQKVYVLEDHFTGYGFYIPAGFKSDLASVPQLFWSIVPPYGKYTKAAVYHDYAYVTPYVGLSRKGVDKMFLEVMKKNSVAPWRARLMYMAVRLFGSSGFVKRKSAV